MHTKASLTADLQKLRIDPKGTLLVHSSMKSIGEVEGGANTVLDALSEYMAEGLLVFPTHTWSFINAKEPYFHAADTPSCVGILTELFRKLPGVYRSWHPTHSVAALGKDAEKFVSGNELFDTPCARGSCWGRLLDRQASILFIGVDLTKNTFIHGVEEWADVPGRITDTHEQLYTVLSDGTVLTVPSRRHIGFPSENFGKVEALFLANGIMELGQFGDAALRLCDTVSMNELLVPMLKENPELFSDNSPLETEVFNRFHKGKA